MASSAVTTDAIVAAVAASPSLAPFATCDVADVTGGGACGAKFEMLLVTDRVEGVGLLDRQRLVHAALGELFGRIHALSMKVLTVAQHEAKLKRDADAVAAVKRDADAVAAAAAAPATA